MCLFFKDKATANESVVVTQDNIKDKTHVKLIYIELKICTKHCRIHICK